MEPENLKSEATPGLDETAISTQLETAESKSDPTLK